MKAIVGALVVGSGSSHASWDAAFPFERASATVTSLSLSSSPRSERGDPDALGIGETEEIEHEDVKHA